MTHTQHYPRLESHGFLERAFLWLQSGNDVDLFYATLELRFTFEKLLLKHGNASTTYTGSFLKLNGKPRELHERLKDEFASRLDIAKPYQFTLDPSNPVLTMGYFLPIPDALFRSYGRLDKYLHAQWPSG
jgi:hypothetical protein